jgi:hypothetical protein
MPLPRLIGQAQADPAPRHQVAGHLRAVLTPGRGVEHPRPARASGARQPVPRPVPTWAGRRHLDLKAHLCPQLARLSAQPQTYPLGGRVPVTAEVLSEPCRLYLLAVTFAELPGTLPHGWATVTASSRSQR